MSLPSTHSIPSLPTNTSLPHSQYHPYFRNSQTKLNAPSQQLIYQQSPRDQKYPFDSNSFINQQHSPQHYNEPNHYYSNYNAKSQRYQMPPKGQHHNQKRVSIVCQSVSDAYSSASRDSNKPKIVFSYCRKNSCQLPNSSTVPNSCGTSKVIDAVQKVDVCEFQLNLIKNQRKQRNLRLCSMLISHSVIPTTVKKNSVKKASSVSRDKLFKTAKANNKFFKTSGFPTGKQQPRKIKQSKIASTQATRSFQAECDHSEHGVSKSQKDTTFDFSSIHAIDLKQTKETVVKERKYNVPKALKKTMTFSRYDFGGIIEPGTQTTLDKEIPDMQRSEQKYRWKSHVKCLFDDGESDLKQSIHCGPEIRAQGSKVEVLTGFGRAIAQSCIPENDIFQ